MDGATPFNAEVAIEKGRAPRCRGAPPRTGEDRITAGRNALINMPVLPIQGGVPDRCRQRECVGRGTVSGRARAEDAIPTAGRSGSPRPGIGRTGMLMSALRPAVMRSSQFLVVRLDTAALRPFSIATSAFERVAPSMRTSHRMWPPSSRTAIVTFHLFLARLGFGGGADFLHLPGSGRVCCSRCPQGVSDLVQGRRSSMVAKVAGVAILRERLDCAPSVFPERVWAAGTRSVPHGGRAMAPRCRSTVSMTSFSIRLRPSEDSTPGGVLGHGEGERHLPLRASGDADDRALGDCRRAGSPPLRFSRVPQADARRR